MKRYRNPYREAHDVVRRVKGKAKTYRCVDCHERATDWSLDADPQGDLSVLRHGPSAMWFSNDPGDYSPRCSRCHKAYDIEARAAFEATFEAVLDPLPYSTGWDQ